LNAKDNLTHDQRTYIHWMILQLIINIHKNSIIEKYKLIYFLVFSGFFGNGNFKPIGLQGKLQAYYYKPTDYHLWDHEPTDKQILKILKI